MLNLYYNFKDTLQLLSYDEAEVQAMSVAENQHIDVIIADQLMEIEGDNYTFLHVDTLKQLKTQGLIDQKIVDLSIALRRSVLELPLSLYNVQNYKESHQWKVIQMHARSIFAVLIQ